RPSPAPARAPAWAPARSPERVVVVGRGIVRAHFHLADLRPQVHHVGGHARQAVVVVADAGVLHALDAADEGDFAALGEDRRIVEAGAAGDEASVGGIGRIAQWPAGAAERRGDHLEAGAVRGGLGLDDAATPADLRT